MIILAPDTMNEADIAELRKNDVCVVVAKNPMQVKFVDPIPAQSSRTQIEDAAIKLSRIILSGQWSEYTSREYIYPAEAAKAYVHCLTKGTALDRNGSIQEREAAYFSQQKMDELSRLARAEAKAERDAAKEASKTKQIPAPK